MGAIVFWTIVRIAILIPLLLGVINLLEYKFWISITIISIYGVIIHPAMIQYRLFQEENREIVQDTLCSTCLHFDETAVICLKYDKHPTQNEIPCEGVDWEPKTPNTGFENIN